MKKLHLICNAHLDPVWLWQWEEGAAEAISTFRVAADFCEEYDGFVFNHNEVILYEWVEEYEPALFERIQKLVAQGKWHIMGGWYLQPDCNMPSGESFVRQIVTGRNYFKTKFGVEPTTAINFDPFGHSRGLVQIMRQAGYDSYLICRPEPAFMELASNDFKWVGFDGSEVTVHRTPSLYFSRRGKARSKIEKWLARNPEKPVGIILWGIGNHGGGPSRVDLEQLKDLMQQPHDFEIVHSYPEAYFQELAATEADLPRLARSLNPWAIGCYTSQAQIKQKHRLLENELYMVEKMASSAALQGYLPYPTTELNAALRDLLLAEFHDILPGSAIEPVEKDALRLMEHGLEILSRLKTRTFFALAAGQAKAESGQIPLFIYNPHPFPISGIFEGEFQMPDQSLEPIFSAPQVYQNGSLLPCQTEKEYSNMSLDWRKHVVFQAELAPSQLNRFDCKIEVLDQKPPVELKAIGGKITFKSADLEVVINAETGLIDSYRANRVDYLKAEAFRPLVIADNEDPWGMLVKDYREIAGQFELMSREQGTAFSGVKGKLLDSVRVIEDGAARSVVQALFSYGNSFICQTYKLPKQGTEIEVEVRVWWNETSKMLKLSVPTVFEAGKYLGQVAYGREELAQTGEEVVAQKWVGVVEESTNLAFTAINEGVYGSDFKAGEMRLSLLRSPGYAAYPIEGRPMLAQDRLSPRIDQGLRVFRFWFNGGSQAERLARIDREALTHNEKPFFLSFFPSGAGQLPQALISLSDEVVQVTAFKQVEDTADYIIRLFEPTGEARTTTLELPFLGLKQTVNLGKFELKTLRLNPATKSLHEVLLPYGLSAG